MRANTIEEAIRESVEHKSLVGSKHGGGAFDDGDAILYGPIDRIKIRHGAHIDAVTMYYNGTPGTQHGGNGGHEEEFLVQPGHVIQEVRGSTDKFVKTLQFITRPISGDGRAESSPIYGNSGKADETMITLRSTEGYPVRSLKGYSGQYLDRLDVHFGYLSRVVSARIDQDNLASQLNDASRRELVHLTKSQFENDSDGTQHETFTKSYSKEESYSLSWEFNVRALVGMYASTTAGVDVKGVKSESTSGVHFELEVGFSVGATTTTTTTKTEEVSQTIEVPPRSRVDVEVVAYKATVHSVPIDMEVEFYKIEKGEEIPVKTFPLRVYMSGDVRSSISEVIVKQPPL